MAIPFTIDISAFYSETNLREQNVNMILGHCMALNLHKELEAYKAVEYPMRIRMAKKGNEGNVIVFIEQLLMKELTGPKKRGALGTIAATVISALIQMAPQIISSIKE